MLEAQGECNGIHCCASHTRTSDPGVIKRKTQSSPDQATDMVQDNGILCMEESAPFAVIGSISGQVHLDGAGLGVARMRACPVYGLIDSDYFNIGTTRKERPFEHITDSIIICRWLNEP